MNELTSWDYFYAIIGPSAGALIGLQFVVMTLIAANPPPRAAEGGPLFSTPTIVHFAATLLISAVLLAPWHAITIIAILWGLMGLSGLVYIVSVTRRMKKQSAYRPEFEDWLFHSGLPLAAYAALALSSVSAFFALHESLFAVGASALLLLFVGIHNSWDALTWHIFVSVPSRIAKTRQDEGSGKDEP